MTELEKLDAGLEYCFLDKEVASRKERALELCRRFNATDPKDTGQQRKILLELFGSVSGIPSVQPDFNCDYGKNIHIGRDIIINYNVTILDIAPVRIGDWCMIGPNTLIATVNHPISPMGRRKRLGKGTPVVIGNDVWIGGNCTILPGVTIGNNVIVGAGAVVTRDIPDNSLVVGVPARIIREIPNDVI